MLKKIEIKKWEMLLSRLCDRCGVKDKCYCGNIEKGFQCARSHVHCIINKLESQGLIKRYRKGRTKIIEVTPRGELACKGIRDVIKALKQTTQDTKS